MNSQNSSSKNTKLISSDRSCQEVWHLRKNVSVRPSASFQTMHAFDAVEVWANNNNDQGGGEGVKKPTSWQPNVRRAG